MMEDATLNKVRLLLAKAESTNNDHEREALNTKAAELIAKYGIDQAMLSVADASRREEVTQRLVRVHAPYALDKITLLHTVALRMRANGVRHGKTSYTMVGYPSDLDRIEVVYSSLLVQMAIGVGLAKIMAPASEDKRTFAKSYYQGFISAVGHRLTVAERAAAEDSGTPGTALVLADRQSVVNREFEKRFPTRGRAYNRSSTGSGRDSGYQDGLRANVGTTTLGKSATAIGS